MFVPRSPTYKQQQQKAAAATAAISIRCSLEEAMSTALVGNSLKVFHVVGVGSPPKVACASALLLLPLSVPAPVASYQLPVSTALHLLCA